MIGAAELPDQHLAMELEHGFRLVGRLPRSGNLPASDEVQQLDPAQLMSESSWRNADMLRRASGSRVADALVETAFLEKAEGEVS